MFTCISMEGEYLPLQETAVFRSFQNFRLDAPVYALRTIMQLSDVPIELLLDHILPILSLKSVLALTCASKFFATLCSDDTFWKLKLREDFNFTPDANTARESGWKVIYRGVRKPSVYTWG